MLLDLLRGAWLLRSPLLRRRLGELRAHEEQLESLRTRFGAKIHSDVVLHGVDQGTLDLAKGAILEKGTIVALGDPLNGYGTIAIGARTWVGEYNNLRASAGCDLTIGEDCLVSQYCSLIGANHDTARGVTMAKVPAIRTNGGVRVGNGVWLGAGATLLPGSTIGDGAVIAANAVVKGEVPAFEIWGGTPARKLGERS